MASGANTAAWFVDKMIDARVQGANEAYAAWLTSASAHEAEFSMGVDVVTLRREEQDHLAKILRDLGFSTARVCAHSTGECTEFTICKDRPASAPSAAAAATAATAPIDDDDKIIARVAEAKAVYDAWRADASARETEFAATVEIADLPRNKQHKMVAILRGSGFEAIRQAGTGRDTLAVSKARPAPPRAIVVGDLPIRVRGAYHAALAFYEDAKPGPHPVSYEVGMTIWSATDRRLLMDALLAKGFTYECKQFIMPNPPRFTATFRKDKPVAEAPAAAATADGTGPIVITRSQPDAHFWVQMHGERGDSDGRLSFQCDRCQVPMSVSSDCRTYEQMTGMFTTLVCPAWMVHRHNPAVYALRKAAEEADAAAASSDEANPNKRQRR